MKADVENNTEGKNSFISLGEYLKREKDLESSRFGGNSEVYKHLDMDDSNFRAQKDSEHMSGSTKGQPLGNEMPKKEAEFFLDKAVTEFERPKMILCFQKDTYQVVKDICIDEGINSCNSASKQTGNMEHRKVYMLSHSTGYESNDSPKEMPRFDFTESLYVTEHPILNFDQKNGIHGSSESKPDCVKCDEKLGNAIGEKVAAEDLPQKKLSCNDLSLVDSSKSEFSSDQIKSAESDSTRLHVFDCSDIQEPASQDVSEETILAIASSSTVEKPVESEKPSESRNGNVEVDANIPTLITQKAIEDSSELQVPGQTVGPTFFREDSSWSTSEPRSLLVHYGHSEPNFYGPGCSSDRITGQLPYSGSISIRSDSSTTSARSFAFPILQSEWNSSPVKMVKADRKHYRKNRHWRTVFFCCSSC